MIDLQVAAIHPLAENRGFVGKGGVLKRTRFTLYFLAVVVFVAVFNHYLELVVTDSEIRQIISALEIPVVFPLMFGLVARRVRDIYGDRKPMIWTWFFLVMIFFVPSLFLMFAQSFEAKANAV